MFWHNLRTLYRALSRHRLYTALNVCGLGIGIAAFLVLLLSVRFEASFDRWIPHADEVFRLNLTWKNQGQAPAFGSIVQGVAAPQLMADYPRAIVTRFMPSGVLVQLDGRTQEAGVVLVDPNFFQVFELPLLEGDRRTALASPTSLVLSKKAADRMFPGQAALGRTLNIRVDGQARSYTITGVLRDLPKNSSIRVPALMPLTGNLSAKAEEGALRNWSNSSLNIYARIPSAAEAARINADLPKFAVRHVPVSASDNPGQAMKYAFMPITEVHFADAKDPSASQSGDPAVVAILSVIGLMVLLIAAINYVNLATARAGLRAREVAVRKTLGATRRTLALQFLGESVALTALAALVGLALTELVLPAVDALGGTKLSLTYLGGESVLIPLVVIVLVVGLGAGAWPALALSRFEPAAVLASTRAPAGGRAGARLRAVLVLAQFSAALIFTICTVVMLAQADYIRRADLGFQRDQLLVVQDDESPELENRWPVLLEAFRRAPGVAEAALSSRSPATGSITSSNVGRVDRPTTDIQAVIEAIGPRYFETFGARVIAGRPFGDQIRADDWNLAGEDGRGANVMLNRTAAIRLGYRDPQAAVGQKLRFQRIEVTIIGVVEDIRFRSPREEIRPLVYYYSPDHIQAPVTYAAIRFRGDPAAAKAGLEQAWRTVAPTLPFEARTVPELLRPYYAPEERRGWLLAIGAGVAVLIGVIGLYGMAAFVTARRTREIGIRKALGASTADVLGLLVGQSLRPVLVAAAIACPVAWLLMRAWLGGFDDRIVLSPLHFALPVLIALLIAAGTVLGHALGVSRAEPAKALRDL